MADSTPGAPDEPANTVFRETLGSGDPVTVLAHGLAGAADDCRPWAAALPGTAVLLELRGHGRSAPVPETGWDYETFATDIESVANETGARQAVAVSVAACALLSWMAREPARFDRVVLVLPAALDKVRSDEASERLAAIGRHATAGDKAAITAGLLAELPPEVAETRLARIWASRRASRLVATPPPLPSTALQAPVADVPALAKVTAEVLVLAERGDALHPVEIAEAVAAAIPGSRLVVMEHGALHWTARAEVTALIAAHLGGKPDQG
jgi:pimeloyl-ACP methyl ester carboxylesterase